MLSTAFSNITYAQVYSVGCANMTAWRESDLGRYKWPCYVVESMDNGKWGVQNSIRFRVRANDERERGGGQKQNHSYGICNMYVILNFTFSCNM